MIEYVSPISRKNDLFGATFGGTPCSCEAFRSKHFLRLEKDDSAALEYLFSI